MRFILIPMILYAHKSQVQSSVGIISQQELNRNAQKRGLS